MIWYGLDGKPTTAEAANVLLGDELARRVAHTTIVTDKGRVTVSTVFLVLDHSHGGPVPVLWESMAFGGPVDNDARRYTSAQDAVEGHAEMVALVKAELEMDGAVILAEETFDGAAARRVGSTTEES